MNPKAGMKNLWPLRCCWIATLIKPDHWPGLLELASNIWMTPGLKLKRGGEQKYQWKKPE